MTSFDFGLRTRIVSGPRAFAELETLARELGFKRTLLVCDEGLVKAGYAESASAMLQQAFPFHAFGPNPDTDMVEAGRRFAEPLRIDSIVGLGGGSSMDCAKAINFLLTNGGTMKDYWGHGKASKPMLPAIGIPTTTGTGSEAQSYALISDSETHVKMACGDAKAAYRVAILDPELAISQPAPVRATAGYDAISHAVESFVTTKRNAVSTMFAREAWRLLEGAYETALSEPENVEALSAMQIGAHFAGVAIENSMLGATHACANPLTAHYGITHGVAIGLLLKHVVRWNNHPLYKELHPQLAVRLDELARAAGLPLSLAEMQIPHQDIEMLASDAAAQWTGNFNPRPFDANGAKEIYECAY
jgi:alcohol dehydrogenase